MYLYDLLTLIITAFAGSIMGSFLLLTLIYQPLIAAQLNNSQRTWLYRRYYRLNSVLCLLGGLLAALISNQQATFVLAILAVSYVFANMHLLKAINSCRQQSDDVNKQRLLRSLSWAQNLLHVAQFIGAIAVIIYLY